jgi:hypothetical protein
MEQLRVGGYEMKNDTVPPSRPSGKIFRAEYESRFGNMPEYGARVLCAFAETFAAELWEPVLDELAVNDGYSTQKKPMIHDIKRSLSRIVAKQTARVVADSNRQRETTRDKTSATPGEVETILSAFESGGAALAAWITDPGRLSVAVRPGALDIIADAYRMGTDWATWAVDQLDTGTAPADIRSQIAPVATDAPEPASGSGTLAKSFAIAATAPEKTDPVRTIGESGRPVKRVDR